MAPKVQTADVMTMGNRNHESKTAKKEGSVSQNTLWHCATPPTVVSPLWHSPSQPPFLQLKKSRDPAGACPSLPTPASPGPRSFSPLTDASSVFDPHSVKRTQGHFSRGLVPQETLDPISKERAPIHSLEWTISSMMQALSFHCVSHPAPSTATGT